MDASTLPKGQSAEVSSDREVNLPGIYLHKESGAKVITSEGDSGVVMADAIVRQGGWERIADVPTRTEVLAMQKAQAAKDAKTEGNPKIKASLEAFAETK